MLATTIMMVSSTMGPAPAEQIDIPTVEPIIIETIEEVPEEKPEVEVEVVVEETVEPEPEPESNPISLTDEEIDLIALCAMGEAEGESEEGKRMVIDVILNRLDSPRFADTVHGVIYAEGQFTCMWNGRVDRCYVRDDIRELVIDELQNRSYSNIHYFRTNYYHKFGTPVVQEGNHYFSTY
jgi:N-acetylmuramoyl-L-alanine amidase